MGYIKSFFKGSYNLIYNGCEEKHMAEMEVLEKDILKLEKEFQQSGSKELYS